MSTLHDKEELIWVTIDFSNPTLIHKTNQNKMKQIETKQNKTNRNETNQMETSQIETKQNNDNDSH